MFNPVHFLIARLLLLIQVLKGRNLPRKQK